MNAPFWIINHFSGWSAVYGLDWVRQPVSEKKKLPVADAWLVNHFVLFFLNVVGQPN
jgi:hypothetical protein